MDARAVAAQRVSQRAEELATQEKVAQQLGRALKRTMNTRGVRFEIEVTADFACDWYEVRIVEQGPWRHEGPQVYVVEDETLARRTTSVEAFHGWIQAVSTRLLSMFTKEPAAGDPEKPNQYLEAVKGRMQYAMRLQLAEEELATLGFQRRREEEYDVEAAIASIMKAMGDDG